MTNYIVIKWDQISITNSPYLIGLQDSQIRIKCRPNKIRDHIMKVTGWSSDPITASFICIRSAFSRYAGRAEGKRFFFSNAKRPPFLLFSETILEKENARLLIICVSKKSLLKGRRLSPFHSSSQAYTISHNKFVPISVFIHPPVIELFFDETTGLSYKILSYLMKNIRHIYAIFTSPLSRSVDRNYSMSTVYKMVYTIRINSTSIGQ